MQSEDQYHEISSSLAADDFNIPTVPNLEAAESLFLQGITQTPDFLNKYKQDNTSQHEALVHLFDNRCTPGFLEESMMNHQSIQTPGALPLSTPQVLELLSTFTFPTMEPENIKQEVPIATQLIQPHTQEDTDVQITYYQNGATVPDNTIYYQGPCDWSDVNAHQSVGQSLSNLSNSSTSSFQYYDLVEGTVPYPVPCLDQCGMSGRGTPFSSCDSDVGGCDSALYTDIQDGGISSYSGDLSKIRPYSRKTPAEKGSLAYAIKRQRNNKAVKKARQKIRERQALDIEEHEHLKVKYDELKHAHNCLCEKHEALRNQLEAKRFSPY